MGGRGGFLGLCSSQAAAQHKAAQRGLLVCRSVNGKGYKSLSYATIGTDGFLGLGRHDVAIPIHQVKSGGKCVLPDATKDTLKAMPPFQCSE
jgi:hypothetical protein